MEADGYTVLTFLLEHPSVCFSVKQRISPSFCEVENFCFECFPDCTEAEITKFQSG